MRTRRLLAGTMMLSVGLVFGGTAANALSSPQSSCVGKFSSSLAPQSAGAFGGAVSGLAQTTDPNLGQGDVTIDALSAHDACRS